MSGSSLVYVTFPSKAEAERVAGTVLAERLAACVNILAPCISIYRWEGRTERSEEVPALFKTRATAARRLTARIAELHSYELPVIESWSVTASDAAAAWIEAETR
ncbi:MAG: divalent-cation tolerance protein CutA [Sphingomonas sp.]|uniref:divalent-cation tolerance protein CutA n=1 Tax=Sphingomonas sp. TaxID=28214 RepID=UPI0025DA06BB|nr:divalent-cation tolerance protein CutA [Sphingomonas sp.]MBX3566277.1 divalent-cation tolerance protein CutA [Sphingomonas sp.]